MPRSPDMTIDSALESESQTPSSISGVHRTRSPASPLGSYGWVVRPGAIFLASRLITLVAMLAAMPISGRGLPAEIDLWDSRWFIKAAAHGWPSQLPMHGGHVGSSTIAFFPVFPEMIRGLSSLTGASLLASGAVVSLATGLTAMVAVWALVREFAGVQCADRATFLFAVFPGSFVISLVYSEGLVITLVAAGLLALLRRRWALAGLMGMVATATSPVALAFVVAAGWSAGGEVLRRGNWRALWAPLLAPLGFVAYMLMLWQTTGSLNAWQSTERGGWHSYVSLAYPFHIVGSFLSNPVGATITTDLLFAGLAFTVVAAVVAVRHRLPAPVLVYGLAAAVGSAMAAPVGLRPRFIFLAFPLIVALGIRLRGASFAVVSGLSITALMGLTMFSVSSFAVFP